MPGSPSTISSSPSVSMDSYESNMVASSTDRPTKGSSPSLLAPVSRRATVSDPLSLSVDAGTGGSLFSLIASYSRVVSSSGGTPSSCSRSRMHARYCRSAIFRCPSQW